VLSKYLERRFGTSGLQGKRLIELGSGCGVLGISAGLLGGEVILTDAKVALTQLSQNVELNLPPLEFPNVHVCQLKWGEDVSAALHPHAVPFDFVLASDVVYNEDTVDALLQSFYDLSDAHTEILLGPLKRWTPSTEIIYSVMLCFSLQQENSGVHFSGISHD
jgi:predicted nicotinamide N-methyase